jgi:hypothetical protein
LHIKLWIREKHNLFIKYILKNKNQRSPWFPLNPVYTFFSILKTRYHLRSLPTGRQASTALGMTPEKIITKQIETNLNSSGGGEEH